MPVRIKNEYLFFDFYNYIRPDFFLLYSPLTKGIFWNNYIQETEVNLPAPPFNHPHSAQLYKAYKLWQNGALPPEKIICANQNLTPPNLKDNYLFITWEFGIKQSFFILIRRLFKLKNPFENIAAFFQAVKHSTLKKINKQPFSELKPSNEIQKQNISVIISTRNRYASLSKLLHQLENQTIPPTEILVIDQSEQIIQLVSTGTLTIKQIPCAEVGFVTGRNLGMSKAEGSLLLFIDDDCEILPDFIEQHIGSLKNGLYVSAGPVIENLNGKLADYKQNKEIIAWHLPGGNFMISKETLSQVGVFNPDYNKLPYEDLEYYLRLLQKDVMITCNFSAPVYHKKLPYGGSRNVFFTPKYLGELTSLAQRKVLKLYAGLIPSDCILILVNNRFLNVLLALFRKIYYPSCFIEALLTILVWPYVSIFCLITLEKNNSK